MTLRPLLAVIPARSGSKGFPGKNICLLAGLPLIAHSIRLSGLCPEIDQCIVSTDSEEIALVSRMHGAEVPFLRPTNLAMDNTPMWVVLQHALRQSECFFNKRFESVLLLQPTAPCRIPEDVARAVEILDSDPGAVGVVAVSEPSFNPRWVCVEDSGGGYLQQLIPATSSFVRRQDVPVTYRINGLLYLWRRDHLLQSSAPKYYEMPHRMLIVPEIRSADVDVAQDLAVIELLLREGLVSLPWLCCKDG